MKPISTDMMCPECGHSRCAEDKRPLDVCPECGLVFWKWEARQRRKDAEAQACPSENVSDSAAGEGWGSWLWALVCEVPEAGWGAWTGRCLLFLILSVWSNRFLWLGPGNAVEFAGSFLHGVNLVFHEAGHVLFSPCGDFLHVLGGSLGQLLMPLVVMLVFLLKNRDPFAASVGLWWLSQNFMDIAIYINDARALALPLLGGGMGSDNPERHDWNHLLAILGLLQADTTLGGASYAIGRLLMVCAWAWGGAVLYRQFRRLRASSR